MIKPLIEFSENKIWQYALCPECLKKLKITEDNYFKCFNCGYKIDSVRIKWKI